ncbi:MAG: hypothetical protein KAR47_04540, partial [Planctomycetes bacterium]|nr:hypothetical protein [Planctomycetota bacterium]
PQVLTVSNVGGSTLHWEMTYDCDWLTAGPASGAITSGTSEIILQPHTSGLAGGVYDCQLAIWNEQAPDSPEMVDVEFVVRGPVLDVSAHEVLFVVSDSRLEPEEHTLSITNSGGAGFDWTAVYNCSWLEIDPPSGSLTDEVDTITLRANPEGLAWGRYSCQLTVIGDNASNSPQTITVSLHAVANVPEDFDTIQAAIDAAFEGDVIVVSPGTYYENITFGEKAVVLTSTDPDDPAVVSDTVIDGMGAGPVVTFPRSPIHNIGLVLRGFTITGGGGVRGGAGIKGGNSLGVISRCVITGNIAKQVGGGIQGFYGTIERCRIEGNFTYGADGAVSGCRATIINCVIRNNHGGGLFNCDGSIVNCTITGNSGDAFGGVRRCDGEIVNTIISGNSFPDMHDENQAQISFSCFPGASGEGNLDVDPEFAFSSGYRIIAGSACIDAGTNDVEYGLRSNKGYGPGLFDIDGSLRITDGDGDGTVTVDIGAFEGTSLKPIIACSAQRIDFYMELSGPEPQDQVVSIRNAGGGILNWQATADCGWLEVAAAGEQTGEITLSADVAGLGVGNYSCMVTVAGEGAINSPRTIEVNLHIHIEGQVHVPAQYGRIQAAIYAAQPGERVIVAPGIYYENIDMAGRNIILQSTDPGNRAVVDSTIIDGSGSGRVATFSGSEDESCVLSGLTITGGRLLGLGNHGAGINGNGTTATISDCAIVGNRTDASGGGLMQCDGMITRCLVAGNRSRVGGGLSNCNGTISNCVVAENTAIIVSGGINNSDGTITNCTIADNIVNSGSGKGAAGAIGGCDGSITNCIFYGNTGSHVSYCSKPSYSCFNGGSTGTGNIRAEPLFALDGDYHLLSDSPCIDAGTNEPDGGLDATDHDGLVRISDGDGDGDGLVDMGAHEFIPGPFIVVSPRSFEFVVMQDRPGPEGQALRLCNSGTGTFDWSIAYDSDWLRVSDDSGSSSGDVDQLMLTVDGSGLDCGFYSCTMTISAPGAANSEMQLAVNLLVKAPLLVPGEYATIQNAINAARAGDIVLVADGVYTGDGNRDIEFGGKAITVTSVSGAENCIIDCQGSEAERHRGFYFHNNEDADSVLDGFTITNGDVVKDKNIWSYGGAIYCYGSSPTIKNCVFRDNAAYLGGGVFVRAKDWPSATGHLSPVLINCDFITNRASYGGGMYSSESNSTIDGGVFVGNHADIGGGGANTGDEDAVFVNCIFTANTANYGAGVYTGQGRSTLTNCVVAFNSTYEGKYDARGAGVFVRQTGHWCTNYWSPCYYYSEAVLTNCILWGNSDPDVVDEASQIFIDGYRAEAALNYSCIQGWTGALGGVGNIGDDPLFVRASDDGGDGWGDYPGTPGVDEGANDDYGDFDLRAGSPCIDAGTDGGIYDDIEGSLRPFDWFGVDNNGDEPEFDMGAYEAVREVEAEAMLVPKAIHATGGKGTILAILYVPRTVESGDIETDSFALYVGEADQPAAEATWSRVIDLPHRSQVFVVFDRDEVLKAAGNIEDLAVRIVGELRSGGYIYAEAGVRILHPPVGASRRPVRRLR